MTPNEHEAYRELVPTPEQIQAWYEYQLALIEWKEKEARKDPMVNLDHNQESSE